MKVALCISNHLRSFEKTYPFLKQSIIDRFSTDVFLHTWQNVGYDGVRGDNQVKNTLVDMDKIVSLFHPKDVLIETMPKFDICRYKLHSGVRNAEIIKGMFYSVMRANELKSKYENKNNFVYDAVIRCRADLLFKTKLEIESNLDYIYVPSFGAYGGVADQFAYGNSKLMDLYAETYNNIDKMYANGINYQGEQLLMANLELYNINVKKCDIRYSLLRANGNNFELAP